MQVLDYSAGFPGARAIKAAGYAGAVRYIGTPGNRKCATKAELDDFNAHGLGMALVFEQTAGQWRAGFEQGKQDARLAREHADAIGFPRGRPIYMAIDQDVVTEDEFRAMGKYLDGAGEVLGRHLTGPYGEYEVCRRSAEWGFRWQWQCRAWSGIAVILHFEGRRLYQYFGHPNGGPNPEIGGVDCDVNEADNPDWGQHNVTVEEEMSWDTYITNRDGAPVKAGDMLAYVDEHVNNVAAMQVAQGAILATVAKDPSVTAARLEEIVKNAVASANAAHLAAQQRQLDATLTVVRDIVGARDEDLAAEVVNGIGRALARTEAA